MSRFMLWQILIHLIIWALFVWISNSALIIFALVSISVGTPEGSIVR